MSDHAECSFCHGTGMRVDESDYRRASATGKQVECDACHGTGLADKELALGVEKDLAMRCREVPGYAGK